MLPTGPTQSVRSPQESIRILELSDEQVSLEQAYLDLTGGETEFAVGSSSSVKEA
jgi:hypothetical protein